MKSLKELYRIGIGPSSSHTMAPGYACEKIKSLYGEDAKYQVTLFGSLASTGKGHGTDEVIKKTLGNNVEVIFDNVRENLPHPNFMTVKVTTNEGEFLHEVVSLGGGAYSLDKKEEQSVSVYPLSTFNQIACHCAKNNVRICDYAYQNEPDVKEYLATVWEYMKNSINQGLSAKGILPGGLNIERKAGYLFSHVNVLKMHPLLKICLFARTHLRLPNKTHRAELSLPHPLAGLAVFYPLAYTTCKISVVFQMNKLLMLLQRQALLATLLRKTHQFRVQNAVAKPK